MNLLLRYLNQFLLSILLLSSVTFGQDELKVKDDINISRSRIMFGYSTLVKKNKEPNLKNFNFNFNYRDCNFDPFSKPLSIKGMFEGGINGVLLLGENDFIFTLIYAKVGPEISLSKELFLNISGGFVVLIPFYVPIPFAGINSSYLIPLNKILSLEIEFGFNTTFFVESSYMVFFTTGIAFM